MFIIMKKLITLLFITLISCSSIEIEVNDDTFKQEYIIPFLELAESHGSWISYADVTILYDNTLPYAGFSNTLEGTITFNKSHPYWNSDAKLVLIYHELAHYYLGKVHIDEECSCEIPFSIMSMWHKEANPHQYEYWLSGQWRELEHYYMRELFLGSNVWNEYPGHENIISHEIEKPCSL